MPTMSLDLAGPEPLPELFSQLPKELRPYLKRGFAVLAKLPETTYADLLSVIVEALPTPSVLPSTTEQLTSRFDIPEDDAAPLLAAASLTVSICSARPNETAENLAQAAVSAGFLDEADRPGVLTFSRTVLQNRATLKDNLDRFQVATATLPSLTNWDATVDLRPNFKEGRLRFLVPVVLLYFTTDMRHRFWCQLTTSQLEQLIKRLQNALAEVQQAEQWVREKTATPDAPYTTHVGNPS